VKENIPGRGNKMTLMVLFSALWMLVGMLFSLTNCILLGIWFLLMSIFVEIVEWRDSQEVK